LRVAADVEENGSLKVRMLDKGGNRVAESKPLARNVTDATIEWTDGFSMGSLSEKTARFEFEFEGATVYSFSFVD
jgi:hypothetical protein